MKNVKRAMGFKSPSLNVFPRPMIMKRAPLATDKDFPNGQLWIYQQGAGTDDVYIKAITRSGSAVWLNMGGGGGVFDTLNVATTAIVGTNLTVGGTLTMSALTAGTVRSSAAGLFSVLADGTDGQVLIGTTGAAPAWSTLTAGGGITIVEAAGTITISNPGATGTTFGTDVGGPVAPDGAGLTTFTTADANMVIDGSVANTVSWTLADDVVINNTLQVTSDFDTLGGTHTIYSDTNGAAAIYLHADGGVNETIYIRSAQGTGVNSINVASDVGGVTLSGGLGAADALRFYALGVGGGMVFNYDTGGVVFTGGDGVFTVTSGTANISIGEDAADHDIGIGDNSGVNILNMVSGTGGTSMASTGPTIIDCADILELNSSGGIISIGNDAVAQNINLGTGAAQRDISIGNVTGTSSTVINVGTGNLDLGVSATAHTTRLGSTNTTCATTIQTGTGAMTFTAGGIFDVNGTGNVTIDSTGGTIVIGGNDVDQNMGFGTDGERIVTIGSANGAASTVLNTGTGNLDLGVNATAHTTRLGSTSGASATTVQAGTGAMTFTAGGAFDVNATGAVTVDGTSITGTSTADAAQAIYLHTNAGTNETIELVNTQGTDAAAIALTATAGGITLTADAATGIVLNAAGSTSIVADTGTAAAAAITLNKRRGVVTLTGLTTASAATQRYTITNSVCQATSGLQVTVANKSAGNDCKITMEACTPAAGSFTVDTKNTGSQALDSDVIITFEIVN